MKRLITGTLILFIWVLTACHSEEKKIVDHYQNYPQHFDNFVSAAYDDATLIDQKNKLVGFDELHDQTKEALRKLDLPEINYVILGGIRCQEANEMEIEIIFNGNWHLQYEPCREGDFPTGKHSEEGFIESWEVSKDWHVWINNDLIG
ncbi:hypothetical protein OKW21_004511 [Catalinimonas alkaloidigena]|uniref:hypothetical protein n=1 Tax=Catalinimonas alkaloidigena TaxID=1075417 RepID=UPI0024067208|nr:hypothetical protein [Catalinimonas alkaloidigena]MDF9799248.1 hypothetical protein [Catalinimonas alkaloidigena]